jgi:hypothetical protein
MPSDHLDQTRSQHADGERLCWAVQNLRKVVSVLSGCSLILPTHSANAHGKQHRYEGYAVLEIVVSLDGELPCIARDVSVRSLPTPLISPKSLEQSKPKEKLTRKPLVFHSIFSVIICSDLAQILTMCQ